MRLDTSEGMERSLVLRDHEAILRFLRECLSMQGKVRKAFQARGE